MKKYFYILLLPFFIFLNACEDEAPTTYIEDYILEGLLIVDKPVQNIKVLRTLPIFDKFVYDSSIVRDASVRITGDGRDFNLNFEYRDSLNFGYFASDTSYKVKPATKYNITVTLKNGRTITGETTTPNYTSWVKPPKEFLQYPIDSLKLPSTDTVAWKAAPGNGFYLISLRCLDTLNYGKYLPSPTEEMNRRITRPSRGPRTSDEVTTIIPIPNTSSSVVWSSFRWYGLHEVIIYVPDWNFIRWYIQAQARGEVDPLLSSVDGGFGYFGSVTMIADTSFVLKNQP